METEIKSLNELLDELKSLNKRKRRLNKLICEHPDNKIIEEKHLYELEVKFLLMCYQFLENNNGKQLIYDPKGINWFIRENNFIPCVNLFL